MTSSCPPSGRDCSHILAGKSMMIKHHAQLHLDSTYKAVGEEKGFHAQPSATGPLLHYATLTCSVFLNIYFLISPILCRAESVTHKRHSHICTQQIKQLTQKQFLKKMDDENSNETFIVLPPRCLF